MNERMGEGTLDEKRNLLNNCLHATLLKMLARIAQDIKTAKGPDQAVTLEDILSYLIGMAKNHGESLPAQIAEVEETSNPQEREQRLLSLMGPFRDEILTKLLPNQANDFVLPSGMIMNRVKNYLYSAFKEALPGLILGTFQGLSQSAVDRQEIVQNYAPAEVQSLENASDALAKRSLAIIKGTLKENAKTVVEKFNSNFLEEQLSHEAQEWLSGELANFGRTENSSIADGWDFAESYLSKVFFNLIGSLALEYDRDHRAEGRYAGQKIS
ncbi:MAG: hypothetical protein HWD61_04955 [Parachlamydiaceae bacterium]|nr:MAG: hypothetical protein HWD61_04955 [Parachlamydiaceae bacterium]